MKTVNIHTDRELQIFTDKNTDEYLGFAGTIPIDDDKVFVDTRDGTGYDKVISKLSKMIKFLATKYRFNGFTNEDVRQHIVVHILEGLPKFDPRKNIKISTFLQMRINRRLINELRDNSRHFRNATFLNTKTYNVSCQCGNSSSISIGYDESIQDKTCPGCFNLLSNAKFKPISQSEVSLDATISNVNSHNNKESFIEPESFMKNINIFGENKDIDENGIIANYDIIEWLKNEDTQTIKLLELICFNDYSLKEAAEKTGLSSSKIAARIKHLRKNKTIKEILDKKDL